MFTPVHCDKDVSIGPATESDLFPTAAIVSEGFEEYRTLFGDDPNLRTRCIVPILRMVGIPGLHVARHGSEIVGVLQVLTRATFWRGRPNDLIHTWWRLLNPRKVWRGLLGLVPFASLFVTRPIRGGELYIATLGVHSKWRRRGIGRALLEYAQREAHRNGCSVLTLHVAEQNAPAINLYTSVGFITERVQRPWLGSRIGVRRYLFMKRQPPTKHR